MQLINDCIGLGHARAVWDFTTGDARRFCDRMELAIDAIRCAKLALERGIGGPLFEASAYLMKHPPKQMRDTDGKRFKSASVNIVGRSTMP